MKQLTPEQREALMADMKSFFENDPVDEAIDEDKTTKTATLPTSTPFGNSGLVHN